VLFIYLVAVNEMCRTECKAGHKLLLAMKVIVQLFNVCD